MSCHQKAIAFIIIAVLLLPTAAGLRAQENATENPASIETKREEHSPDDEPKASEDGADSQIEPETDATAPDKDVEATGSDVGVTFGQPAKYRWRVGVKIVTGKNSCRNLLVTIPLPNDWPEQTVSLDEENIPNSVQDVSYRDLDSGVRQLVIKLRKVPAKSIIELDQTYAVKVDEIVAPTSTDKYLAPKKLKKEIKQYLGVSPGISFRNSKLRKQVKNIVGEKETAWQQVEALYDWVRENIEYRDGDPEDSISAFRAKSGCAEDLVGLFIAMCRAHKVPARTVWVEGHQYAEFYLLDAEEKGHWFPCNVAGLRDFGSNSDPRIILQKGDNIKVPEKENRQRYVAEFVTGSGNSKPAVGFVRDLLPAK